MSRSPRNRSSYPISLDSNRHRRAGHWRRHRKFNLAAAERLEDRQLLTTFVVDTRFDLVDSTDEVTSLREALDAANDEVANPGHDTIEFDKSLEFATISNQFQRVDENGFLILPALPGACTNHGAFTISSDVTIDGSSAGLVTIGRGRGVLGTFDQDTTSTINDGFNVQLGYCGGRILNVAVGANVEVNNVVIQGGDVNEGNGGGIQNSGSLTLRDSVVGSNLIRDASGAFGGLGGDFKGGGIHNASSGDLTLVNTHIGEISLTDDFLASIGVDGQFYVEDASNERGVLNSTLVVTVPFEVVNQDRILNPDFENDPTRVSGNIVVGQGGGIYNEGLLHVTEGSVIEANRATRNGIGVYNTGTMAVTDSTVQRNHVPVRVDNLNTNPIYGFAWNNSGAGIYNEGSLVISNSQFLQNVAYRGGAIYNTGTLDVSDTSFDENGVTNYEFDSPTQGGTIYDDGNSTTITRSTISNSVAGLGGAVFNNGNGDFTFDTSTIANNTSNSGGGLYGAINTSTTFISTTISHNISSVEGGGIWTDGIVSMGNSVVADNMSPSGADIFNTSGVLNSLGGNVVSSSAGNSISSIANATDVIDVDAMIGPLGDNGGPTQTVGLRPGSPAINSATALSGSFVFAETDQRGQPRVNGTAADRGAFEFQPPTTMRVETLDGAADGNFAAGEMSLADAIDWANVIPGHDTIALNADFVEQLRAEAESDEAADAVILLSQTLNITDDLTIYGPGADLLSVSGNNQVRVFDVAAGVSVNISGLTIRDGYSVGEAAGINNGGNLVLSQVVLTGNFADGVGSSDGFGGGLYNRDTGTVLIDSSTVDDNEALEAGGGIYSRGTATIVNSTISDNRSDFGAAIYHAFGTTHIGNSTVVNNVADDNAGGIRSFDAGLTVGNSIVAKNVAPSGPDMNNNAGSTITSLGHNLIGVAATGFVDGVNGDQVGTAANPNDPLIGVLRNLGGPTPTHGLLPTSPAIDAGDTAMAQSVDQRGVLRPVGSLPDIGAFEYEAPLLTNPVVVDSLLGLADGYFAAGEMSLGEAILFANDSANHPTVDTIVFDSGLFLDADGGDLDQVAIDAAVERFTISDNLNLVGPGADKLSISGSLENSSSSSSIFTVAAGVTFDLSNLTINGNFAPSGGGIHNQGVLHGDQLYITGNGMLPNGTVGTTDGGGVFNDGVLHLSNSTIAHNTAFSGGGLANSEQAQAYLTNVTVSGNYAEFGGGIFNNGVFNADGGLVDLKHVTVADNEGILGGGFWNSSGATIRFGNSIIAGNVPGSTGPEGFNEGIMETVGGNLIGNNIDLFLVPLPTDLILATGQNGDFTFETFLGELQIVKDYQIPMHAVLPNSPAVDLGIMANGTATDQRGFSRPVFGGFDAGSFELQDFSWGTEIVVSEFSDKLDGDYDAGRLSLREAILWSNFKDGDSVSSGVDVITFDPGLVQSLVDGTLGTNTLVLAGETANCNGDSWRPGCGPEPQLLIEQDVIIIDPGSVLSDPVSGADIYRISGDNATHVLEVAEGVTAEISGLTFTDGRSAVAGGGIFNLGDLTLHEVIVENSFSLGSGAGIYNGNGTLQIEHSTIRNNVSEADGAGIYSITDGTLSITTTTLHDNYAGSDGIGSGGGVYTTGSAVIEGSTLFGNMSANNGGAIRSGGNLVLVTNTTISDNHTGGASSGNENGGAIYTGNMDLYHVTLANNTSEGQGGGIRSDGHLGVYNSIIANNSSLATTAGDDDIHNFSGDLNSEFSLYSDLPAGVSLGTNQVGDPKLGLLGDNGGPTWTHGLDPLSPAVDAGNTMAKPVGVTGMRLTDQRGRPLADVNGPASSTGAGYLAFNDDIVTLPNTVLDGMASVMTEFRFRTTDTTAQAILSSANTGQHNEYTIFYLNANTIRVIDQGDSLDFGGLPNLADGQWHHIAVARDYIRDFDRLFVDGFSYGKQLKSIGSTNLSVSSGGLVLGQDQDEVGGNYSTADAAVGDLDEVRFWDGFWPLIGEAQEEAQILAHIQQYADIELSGTEPDLVAYYKFNEPSGNTVMDSAGGQDGTLGDSNGTGADARPAPTRVFLTAPDYADIGAYEIQQVSSSAWRYEALGASQFGAGDATVLGFGFDDGRVGSDVDPDPYFLGFEFDTGRRTYGGIETDVFGGRYGGELTVDFAGQLGFDLGFYVNSGSVDVTYDGAVNYVIDAGSNNNANVSAFVDVQDGGLYTISPKVGAYADLVLRLDADVEATGCLVGCVNADLIDIHVGHTEEMFALNRQMTDDEGRTLFFNHDNDDEPVARDSTTGVFYDLDGQPLANQNVTNITPIFDGDIRYFSLPIEEIARGTKKAYDTVREKIEDRRAASQVSDAENDYQKAANRVEQNNDELEKAKQQMRNPAGGTAAEVVQARERVTELAGKEYADRVLAGTENEVPKQGKIKESEDAAVAAHEKRNEARSKLDKRKADKKKRNEKLRAPKAVVGISVGEADGNLLGAQVDLEAGVTAGPFNLSKNIGSLQVTLPDVNLRDTTVAAGGGLSATTDDFAPRSELDEKRQIAKAQLDLAAVMPVIPGGKYNVSAGPISLDVTTVSYNVGPQLNVTQDVSAVPITNTLTYEFIDPTTETFACVNVLVDALAPTEFDATGCAAGVRSVTFPQDARVNIDTAGLAIDGQAVRVEPTMNVEARFSNDIGLDIDLDGVFEAFALNLSAFGVSIVDIGPLIRHAHTLAQFDVGSIFDRTWDLPAANVPLAVFTLFDQTMDGRTAATALSTMPTPAENEFIKNDILVSGPTAVWVASEMADPALPDQDPLVDSDGDGDPSNDIGGLYTVLDVVITGDAGLDGLAVLDPQLTVIPGATAGTYQISGFSPELLAARSSALFAMTFSSGGTANVTATRSAAITLDGLPFETENTAGIGREDLEVLGVSAALSLDIDQDGIASPLTDGVLLMRHLDGKTGAELIDGAVDLERIIENDRTGRTPAEIEAALPSDIANYIENVLKKSLFQEPGDRTSVRSSLDLDDSGGDPAVPDGELLARYIAGFSDASLTSGLTSLDPQSVVSYIETGRISASDVNTAALESAINTRGDDVLGLTGAFEAAHSDGSSATGAVDPDVPAGAAPEFALSGELVMAGSVPTGYDFFLDQYNQSVTFEELYLNGELISRVAEGSPLDFGSEQYKDLIRSGVSSGMTKLTGTALLGSEEPIFVRAPDAAAYEYESLGDFEFETIVIDPQVGGNLLLPSQFDLYLLNNGKWEFETTISDDNPEHVGVNGFLTFTFVNGPVSQFRLFSHALPNKEIHDVDNTVADDQAAELFTTTGFLFPAGTGTPEVLMTPIAERQLFTTPDPLVAPSVDLGSIDSTNEFRLVRSNADLLTSINGADQPVFQMTGAEHIEVVGHDNAADTLLLDSTGGPIHTPLFFDAGFRDDSLLIDTTHGEGLTIDLVQRDTLHGVETIDIRGTGANQLLLDVDAVLENDPFTRRLVVLADGDDAVQIGAGWTLSGSESVNGETLDVYTQGKATLLVSPISPMMAEAILPNTLANLSPDASESNSQDKLLSDPVVTRPVKFAFAAPQETHQPMNVELAQAASLGAPQQIVTSSVGTITVPAGQSVQVDLNYASDGTTTTGLHLRMHFDSSQLMFDQLTNVLPHGIFSAQVLDDGPCNDEGCRGYDNDPTTDKYVNLLWYDVDGNWPANNSALLTAHFATNTNAPGVSSVKFTGNPAGGYNLTTDSIDVIVVGETPTETKINAIDLAKSNWFGHDVDVDGDWAVVSAYGEDALANNAGAVYVFHNNAAGVWKQTAKLTASDGAASDQFGYSAAISGNTIVVGARLANVGGSNTGAAYIFERDTATNVWSEVIKLNGSNNDRLDRFGVSVDIDGNHVIVGAHKDETQGASSGAAYIFGRDVGGPDAWGEVAALCGADSASNDNFGTSVAIDGGYAVVGAYLADLAGDNEGAAYLFRRNAGGADNWGQMKKLTASDGASNDQFGIAVSISGNTLAVGARLDDDVRKSAGSAYVFERHHDGTNNWGEASKLTASDPGLGARFGQSLTLDVDTLVVGASYLKSGSWTQVGGGYVFGRHEGSGWGQIEKLTADDAQNKDRYATSVAVSGNRLVVGAPLEDPGATNAGSVYIHQVSNTSGPQQAALAADAAAAQADDFGWPDETNDPWLNSIAGFQVGTGWSAEAFRRSGRFDAWDVQHRRHRRFAHVADAFFANLEEEEQRSLRM